MRIVKNGDVHVSAPIGMPKKEVERFIEEHREWIAEAQCPFPCTDGLVLPPLEGSQKRNKADM